MPYLYRGKPFELHSRRTVIMRPGWLYSERQLPRETGMRQRCQYARDLLEAIEQANATSLGVIRTHALGDILMLTPILHAILRSVQELRVVLIVSNALLPALRNFGIERVWIRPYRGLHVDYGCDLCVNVSDALEVDHRGGWESRRHRVDLYAHALGFRGIRQKQVGEANIR